MSTCYTGCMPTYAKGSKEKKSEMLGLKVEPSDKAELIKICESEDRPIGYVARELMLRGLAAYRRDRLLKEPDKSPYELEVIKVRVEDEKKEGVRKRRA